RRVARGATMALTTEDTAMLDGSVELWRAVLDTAQDGIVICEARGAEHPLVYANSAFWRLTGYTPEDLLGQDLRRLQSWDQEQTEERSRLRVALARGESCRALLRNYRKDGTQFWNELQIAPLPGPDGMRRFVGYHRDVSERE